MFKLFDYNQPSAHLTQQGFDNFGGCTIDDQMLKLWKLAQMHLENYIHQRFQS